MEQAHPLFERVPDAEVQADAAAALISTATEESKKVMRIGTHGKEMFTHIYRRKER